MASNPPPQNTELEAAIEGYSDRLAELLGRCERALAEGQDEEFLWNARRALEALCRLLIAVSEGKVSRDPKDLNRDLNGLIQHLKSLSVINDAVEKQLDLARTQTNLGVHIRQPEREDYSTALTDVRHHLPQLVVWAVNKSRGHERLYKRQELRLSAQRIGGFASDSQNRPAPLGGRSATATTDNSQDFTDSRTTDGTGTTQVRTRGVASDTDPTAVTEATDPSGLLVTDTTVPKAAPSRRNGLLIGGAVAVGTFAGVWVALTSFDARPTADASPAPEAAVAVVAPPPVAEAELNIEPRMEPPPPPPEPTCPAGMTLIPASTITIGQPKGGRKNWPTPRPATIAPIDVPAFCVHNAPVTLAEWVAWPRRNEPELASKCEWGIAKPPKAPGSPAHCVGRAAAVTYCATNIPGGRLPTIAEWEALARSEAKNLGQSGAKFEWAGDLFPPAVFNRRVEPCRDTTCQDGMIKQTLDSQSGVDPVGDVLWSWSTRKEGESHNELTFRCAVEPTP